MFPQSELENYKLQVELLQEKLQRSEISRQQLEHKLDKILQKRDEHDKILRTKTKQKYQQFLEEQQRRNERNKQLVEMLERIEQQTAAMNARSERLKMMKLQYEMYFAKLVHSQTRRCLQTSVMAMTAPPMMTAMASGTSMPSGVGTIPQKMMGNINTSSMDGCYGGYPTKIYEEPTILPNNYQRYELETAPFEQNRKEISSDSPIMGTANSDYTLNSSFRSDNSDVRRDIPKPYFTQERYPENNNRIGELAMENKTPGYELKANNNTFNGSRTSADFDLPTTPTSSSVSDRNNMDRMLTPNIRHVESYKDTITSPNIRHVESYKDTITANNGLKILQAPAKNERPQMQELPIPTQKAVEPISNAIGQVGYVEAIKQQENLTTKPSELENHIKGYSALEETTQILNKVKLQETPQTIYKEEKLVTPEPKDIVEEPQPKEQEATNLEKSPTNPVSIENIENALGELVNSSEETQNVPPPELATVPATLLENLVTQPPTTSEDIEEIIEQPSEHQEQKTNSETVEAPLSNENKTEEQENQLPSESYDYNATLAEGSNITNNEEYAGYENNTNIAEEGQEQQQYDYSNYDPTQYTYPGYIYDEATGEYKPDPNATAEQYAQDGQQYAAEGYDQQYQQQEGYDYNQAYEQQELQPTDATDPNAMYENYDTTQKIEPTEDNTFAEQAPQEIQQNLEEGTEVSDLSKQPSTSGQQKPKPTSILATGDKKDGQKNKKRVNFVDSSETDESSVDKGQAKAVVKPSGGNESDFDFSSSSEVAPETK
ncbi:uncharacterized protein [Musca autumnalis]|uniref:uncharacterized protein n=1 Tax=Musca autumnalis TaxID=221902 RepID=UPI003CE81AF2